jgi:thiosulfate/3-mercaptopyruvate sulfurtransferase
MGIRSGYASMILRAVGFDKVRNYEGSIYEWSGDKNMPMEI